MNKKKTIRHAGGIIRPTPYGTYRAEIFSDGAKHRDTLKTIEEAKTWIEFKRNELDVPTALAPADYHDAVRARELLPAGVTILDAARCWLNYNVGDSPTIGDAVAEWIEHKRNSGLRPRTLISARNRIEALASSLGTGLLVGSVTPDQITKWLNARELAAVTRNNYRIIWNDFFGWCVGRRWCATNPVDSIQPARLDQRIPGILTVKQTIDLLTATAKIEPSLLAYLAIGLFAGIRPAELARLKWSAIKNEIHIGPEVAKVRRQRFVTITDNLAEWIRRTRASGLICPHGHNYVTAKLKEARAAARIASWPHDALRHSFATYHLALYQDAPRTAHELGHQSPAMLYAHYRALATNAQAQAYFSITPAKIMARKRPADSQVK